MSKPKFKLCLNDDTGMTFYDEGATTPTSGKDELIETIKRVLDQSNLSDFAKEGILKLIAQSNESAVRQALEGLLEHSEVYPEKGMGSINPVRAVPVSAIQNELKDIWFTDDLPSILENLDAAANRGGAPTLKSGDASS